MHPRLLFSLLIYIGSYLPLSLILLAQDIQYEKLSGSICWEFWDRKSSCQIPLHNPVFSIFGFLICLVSFLITRCLLHSRKPNLPIYIISSSHRPTELMNYTLPYVVSFMGISYASIDQFIGFLIFFSWIFVISHRSGQNILNPVLIIIGWRLYEIEYRYPKQTKIHKSLALSTSDVQPDKHCSKLDFQKVMIIENLREGESQNDA